MSDYCKLRIQDVIIVNLLTAVPVYLSSPQFPQMPVLIAATVASDKPTDGYLVKDIISILSLILGPLYLQNLLIWYSSSTVYHSGFQSLNMIGVLRSCVLD